MISRASLSLKELLPVGRGVLLEQTSFSSGGWSKGSPVLPLGRGRNSLCRDESQHTRHQKPNSTSWDGTPSSITKTGVKDAIRSSVLLEDIRHGLTFYSNLFNHGCPLHLWRETKILTPYTLKMIDNELQHTIRRKHLQKSTYKATIEASGSLSGFVIQLATICEQVLS